MLPSEDAGHDIVESRHGSKPSRDRPKSDEGQDVSFALVSCNFAGVTCGTVNLFWCD